MNRKKLAELTSGIGALLLGFGLGALFAPWVAAAAMPIAAAGLVAHAFGMWDSHRLDAQRDAASPRWIAALYGLCWLALVAVLLLLIWNWSVL